MTPSIVFPSLQRQLNRFAPSTICCNTSITSQILSSRDIVESSISTTCNTRGYSTGSIPSSGNRSELNNLITGVTAEMIEKDAALADYIRSNYPDKFSKGGNDQKPAAPSSSSTTDVARNWGEQRRQQPKPPLNIRTLATIRRDSENEEGSNRCFPMRREGFIPGVIYGGDPTQGIHGHDLSKRIFVKTPNSSIQSELDRYGLALGSRVFDVTVYENYEELQEATNSANIGNSGGGSSGGDGIVYRVMPRDIQLHPVNDTVYCCNFLRYFPGRPIKIPVTLINEEESPALKRDGYLIPINRFVECVVEEGVPIPEELEVECTGLQFKQVIRLDRVVFPEGVTPSRRVLKHNDFMIGPIHGKSAGGDDDVAGEEAEEGD